MAKFCLIPKQVQDFKLALKEGRINPQELSQKTSEERRNILSDIVGKENASQVNALFESKLLLKNQQAGYIRWAKKVAGLTPQAKRDIISRIEKMDKILNPGEEKMFLEDLARQKLGIGVSDVEAKTIFDLSQKVQSLKKDTFTNNQERLNYGRSVVQLTNYLNDLKKVGPRFSLNPVKIAKGLPGNAKAIRASMDNSAIFRQGWKTLFTHPGTWAKNSIKSFKDIVKTFGGKNVIDELNADIVSRQNSLNGFYKRAKLAVGTLEEDYPTALPEKIPILGRAYKASEAAYTGFVHKTRADIFDKYIQIAQNKGVNLNDKELQAIGSMVNSLTGRASLPGQLEKAANTFNNVFFSPRKFVADVNTFLHPITGAGGSNFVRKQASINLLKTAMGTAAILGTAYAVNPNSVEWDARSADFGKIKIGNTRFDVTGGLSSLITLASRLITSSSKSSTTGEISDLNNPKYGQSTKLDVIYNFMENKFSPALSVVKDILQNKDFKGNPPTIGSEIENLFVPLSISTFKELKNDPNSADILLSMIADGLGISVNTYGQLNKNWNQNTTTKQNAFKEAVGQDKFNQANQDFNKEYDAWFSKTSKTTQYKNLSNDEKQALLTDSKSKLQEKIFKNYGFVYKNPPKKKKTNNVKSLLP